MTGLIDWMRKSNRRVLGVEKVPLLKLDGFFCEFHNSSSTLILQIQLIGHPLLLVLATSERFLPTWAIFKISLASENHWLQPMLVLIVH